MPGISVIVSSVRVKTLPQAVESILRQSFTNWELIVVDQSHAPDTCAYLSSLSDSRIRHMPLDSRGKSRAQNAGIAAARAEIIAVIDDDCEAAPNWLESLPPFFEAGEADLLFGPLVAPASYNPGTEFCPTYPVPEKIYWTWQAVSGDVGGGLGANMALSRHTVETLGIFDTALGAGSEYVPSGEETDYALRALGKNLKVLSAPIPAVVHTYGVRPGEEGKRLQQIGNHAVGLVHQKMLMGAYRESARLPIDRLYSLLRRQVIIKLLRGERRQLGINRLQAMLKGRAHMRRNFTVDGSDLLVPRSKV